MPGIVNLDLRNACDSGSPAQNNLGGLGPDSGLREMRFANVGSVNGERIDMIANVRAVWYPLCQCG